MFNDYASLTKTQATFEMVKKLDPILNTIESSVGKFASTFGLSVTLSVYPVAAPILYGVKSLMKEHPLTAQKSMFPNTEDVKECYFTVSTADKDQKPVHEFPELHYEAGLWNLIATTTATTTATGDAVYTHMICSSVERSMQGLTNSFSIKELEIRLRKQPTPVYFSMRSV